MDQIEIAIKGQTFLLLPEKGILWKEKNILLLADLHLGKIAHFRKAGIAIPHGPEYSNWERISYLVQAYNPEQVIILGDLFHSDYNQEWNTFKEVIETYSEIKWVLVKGNHDILRQKEYDNSSLDCVEDRIVLEPFILTHEPMEEDSDYYNLCGHIHPGVRLRGHGRQSARVPCFYFKPNQGILPAFGAFTGLYTIQPEETDSIYLIVEDKIIDATAMMA